jgi:hypothetical protein
MTEQEFIAMLHPNFWETRRVNGLTGEVRPFCFECVELTPASELELVESGMPFPGYPKYPLCRSCREEWRQAKAGEDI